MPDDKDAQARQTRRALDAYSLAFLLPGCIGGGFLIGWGLDKLFHTSPWMTFIFTGLGIVAGFINLFRIGLRA